MNPQHVLEVLTDIQISLESMVHTLATARIELAQPQYSWFIRDRVIQAHEQATSLEQSVRQYGDSLEHDGARVASDVVVESIGIEDVDEVLGNRSCGVHARDLPVELQEQILAKAAELYSDAIDESFCDTKDECLFDAIDAYIGEIEEYRVSEHREEDRKDAPYTARVSLHQHHRDDECRLREISVACDKETIESLGNWIQNHAIELPTEEISPEQEIRESER